MDNVLGDVHMDMYLMYKNIVHAENRYIPTNKINTSCTKEGTNMRQENKQLEKQAISKEDKETSRIMRRY